MAIHSVVVEETKDGRWRAVHLPSGKIAEGASPAAAEEAMRNLIGIASDGDFHEPLTSGQFSGVAHDIALFLEGEISRDLGNHAGFARLEAFRDGIAEIRLGGGCDGCPASLMTLVHGVRTRLQEEFGEEVVVDVIPAE
jgi:Fe-S cluster biogenesis protein NfuA